MDYPRICMAASFEVILLPPSGAKLLMCSCDHILVISSTRMEAAFPSRMSLFACDTPKLWPIRISLYCLRGMFYVCIIFAFLVMMPMFVVLLWLLRAHVEAPVFGSVILAGGLLNLAGYGLIRVFPVFKFGFVFFYLFGFL